MMSARGIALAIAFVLAAGCSGFGSRPDRTEIRSEDESEFGQVLVAVRKQPPLLRDRVVRELAADYELRPRGGWPLHSLELECLLFEIATRRGSLEDVVPRLERDHRVELVAPISRFRTLQAHTAAPDSYRHLQYGTTALRVEDAHQTATGRGVVVAVIDTGVDINHPELRPNVGRAHNFVRGGGFAEDLHGTAVAGVVAASGHNGSGMVGIAPHATLLALKACWHKEPRSLEAVCTSYTLAQAIDAAIKGGADVLNLSLTGPADPILERLIEAALERKIAVIAASGESPQFPASQPGVLAVRAAGPDGSLPEGSRAPRDTELVAPGVDILTTVPGGRYDFLAGSSLAAAHVSGLAALLLEQQPELTPQELGRVLAPDSGDSEHRVADACRALGRLLGSNPCDVAR